MTMLRYGKTFTKHPTNGRKKFLKKTLRKGKRYEQAMDRRRNFNG